ncbi:MAG: hypothetical protein KME20_17020 [Kaiparowitsia implicata GSE-PSE-MK54-09C]|jgi:hypothetical protein|nr:hypothetical protein [Kaiparowitsia implicata GSE-PSE-MK54-09C]
MTASTSSQFFGFDFTPSPTQDTDIAQHLGFLPGLKEMLMVRQVHALEHATVWVLAEMQQVAQGSASRDDWGGMSTDEGFYLYGAVETEHLRRAVAVALQRLTSGEWNLAVHPRCGTNLSVGMLMTAGLAAGLTVVLPKDPLGQLLGFGMAAATAASLSPDVGSLAQRYVTTAIPFNLAIADVSAKGDRWGQPMHFVRVSWLD